MRYQKIWVKASHLLRIMYSFKKKTFNDILRIDLDVNVYRMLDLL